MYFYILGVMVLPGMNNNMRRFHATNWTSSASCDDDAMTIYQPLSFPKNAVDVGHVTDVIEHEGER